MNKGFQVQSQGIGMNELITMSKELHGLRNVKLTDEGLFAYAVPKQIISESGGAYKGLPELIMAEDFANIPVTLEKEYTNYTLPEMKFRGIFDYDLNKHLIQNLLDFRDKIRDKAWLSAQTEEVQGRLLNSMFFIEEEGEKMVQQKSSLINDEMTDGVIIKHIQSYNTDLIFYTDPQITYKLNPEDRPTTVSVFRKVETEEDAELFGVPIGTSIKTPWMDFSNQYDRAFNKIYIDPIREAHPQLDFKAVNDLPEVQKVNENKLVGRPAYLVVTLMARIPTDAKESIEVKSGAKIPTSLSRMQLKAGQFQRYFDADKESDIHFDPSFAIYKVKIPKRVGDGLPSYLEQYKGMAFNKPEVTIRQGIEDSRVPTVHPEDKEFSKRFKEEMLNFPFKETYVTADAKGFGAPMKLSAINEVIRNIALPLYEQLGEIADGESTKNSMKWFLTNSLGMEESELEVAKEGLSDGQFSGIPQPVQPQPVQPQPVQPQPVQPQPVQPQPVQPTNNDDVPY